MTREEEAAVECGGRSGACVLLVCCVAEKIEKREENSIEEEGENESVDGVICVCAAALTIMKDGFRDRVTDCEDIR
jgi:hypothetical protein